jgi:hypothetical protein
MNAVIRRIGELLRPADAAAPSDPVQTLTIDLAVAAVGFGVFGASIAAGGDIWWHLLVSAKVAGIFLTAFVLSLPPIYAIKKFFDVEAKFADIVSVFAGHLALGAIFAAAGTGVFHLLRRGEIDFDGGLAVAFIGAAIAGVLICRARRPIKWLAPLPAAMTVFLFLGLLAQSAWAFRPYMDPESPTLFQAKLEWFAGAKRSELEKVIVAIGGKKAKK